MIRIVALILALLVVAAILYVATRKPKRVSASISASGKPSGSTPPKEQSR